MSNKSIYHKFMEYCPPFLCFLKDVKPYHADVPTSPMQTTSYTAYLILLLNF
ncbi:hypothetical protein HanPSC8_Chr02g0052171 [Helianthus annuus]|nr:hypothetical protein HanPSC8_Chr02g0052171 [Helianthus annuus]